MKIGASLLPTDGGGALPVTMDTEADKNKELRIVVFGLPLYRVLPSRGAQMAVLAVAVVAASMSFAALQERVLYVPGFHYTGWMAIVTSVTYVVCAGVERSAVGEHQRHGSMVEYAKLSTMTMGGMYLTNWSLRYLSYPLRVVFKSSKLMPVMLLSVIYLRKTYSTQQYCSVTLLCVGVMIFTLGDAQGAASFSARGIAIILAGSFLEALGANFEEQRLFNQLGCSASEVVLYSSWIGCVWAVMADILNGDLLPALQHSRLHPETVPIIAMAALAGYAATNGALLLIKNFGATVAEIVKSCRKILTICISFVLYGKQWSGFHVVGCLFFVASVSVERSAAGGASRRFAGLLLSGSLLGALVLLSSSRAFSTFSVVIDAGSLGTRVNIFCFDGWTSHLVGVRGEAQVWFESKIGIGAFVNDPNTSRLEMALRPLIEMAEKTVPPAQRATTPLTLRSTGMRLLPTPNAEKLLNDVKGIIAQHGGFKDAGVKVLEGEEESECEWLTINFLMGTFGPGVQSVSSPVAVVDLGGESVQMAYFVNASAARTAQQNHQGKYIRELGLPYSSGNAYIYQHSYPKYGLMTARVLAFDNLTKDGEVVHPCLPNNMVVVWGYGGREFRARGSSDKSGCAKLVANILDPLTEASSDGPGSGQQRMVLVSFFYDRMVDVGAADGTHNATLSVGSFNDKAGAICDASTGGFERLQSTYPKAAVGELPWLCFDLTYQAALLGKRFRLEAGHRVVVVKKIPHNGLLFEASWALGMAIKSTTKRKVAR